MSADDTQEKQNYLRQNIMDAGYDTNAFVEFLMEKKGEEGADVSNWSLPDLKDVVQEFIALNGGGNNAYEDNNQQQQQPQQQQQQEKYESNETNNEQKENKQQSQQQPQYNKPYECNYGILTNNVIHCEKPAIGEISNCDNIQIKVGDYEKVEGKIFSKAYVSYVVKTLPFNWSVKRRFSDFEWLRQHLVANYSYCLIPSIPKKSKNITKMVGANYDNEFLAKRSRNFEKFLNYIIIDPILKNTQIVYDFLSMTKDDEFQKMKKAVDKVKNPVFSASKAITIDGNANIEITDNKEKYLNVIKDGTIQNENTLKKINATIKALKEDLINATEKLSDISRNFTLMKDNAIKFNENNSVIQSYAEMSSMFENFSLYLSRQRNLIFVDLREYFKLVKNNFRSMKDFVHKTENLKNTFYKSFKNLKVKKEDLFRKQEVNKWDLDPKDTSIDRNSIASNKNLALEKMLHKETLQVNYQKVVYGFYLNRIIDEHERMRLINGNYHLKNCLKMLEIETNNCTNFVSTLADNSSNLRKNQKIENTNNE